MKRISFELQGTEYNIPNVLTIENYVKIYKVKDLFDEDYFLPKLINILTGAPIDLLLRTERGKVQMLFKPLMDILPVGDPAFLDRFELDGVEYGFIPSWKKMSFGEFADLDTLMTKKPEEMLDYLHIITAIMYRPIINEKSKHKFEIEEYNQITLEDRGELFKKKLDVEVAFRGTVFFYPIRKELFKSYPNIFEGLDENQLDSDKNRMEDEEMDFESNFQKTFGWYIVLNRLSHDDITRHEQIIGKTITEALNQLSYILEKEKVEVKLQKRAQGQII